MLKKIDPSRYTLTKKEYKTQIDTLETKFEELQRKIIDLQIPVIIAFEGWSASGKGACISKIVYPLDPRCFNVYTMGKIPEDVAMRPFLWNYWQKIPSKGRMTIFDKSWHRASLPEQQSKRPLTTDETNGFYYDINAFERQLSDDGVLIIKFFLHISKNEQRRRFDELLENPDTKWRVDRRDINQNKNYETHLKYFDDMIRGSDFDFSRWSIIESDDLNYAAVKIYNIIINKIEEKIRGDNYKSRERPSGQNELNKLNQTEKSVTRVKLSEVNPDKNIAQAEYKERLAHYQKKLSELGYKLYTKRRPVVIVYEGWDAAGKGGNIKRLTQRLDPRSYEVIPVAAPSKEELAHHYLWRFWKAVPKDGHFGIFDRSWYGRVLVERVENLCSETEWRRAYREINDMEKHLYNHGAIIFKFWLHIDQNEQLRRFQNRETDPLKQYKITEEDWRNREKWEAYEKAAGEMLFLTGTNYSPWTVIESNNKKYARIKTLKILVETLEERLK
ncbi:MAG: polyphosphate:AMP phosphotransferase [Oscillospiraceae bacterium]|nr:polyphosphate:AMP phosphotransferase [Oscillospiraceae bacterium]